MAFGLGRTLFRSFRTITKPLIPVLWVPLIYTILSSIGLILNMWTSGDMLHDEQFSKNPDVIGGETFDFIIVGAGSAGSVVANRLSKKYRVLLLEAGGEPNPLQYIPGFGVFFINYPETDWMHKTVPQKYACLNSVNQQSSWSAGKTLGGTGTLNLLVHLRGHKNDFDNWGRILGDSSWSWEGVLPFFKSYEDYEEGGDAKYHGYGGDLRVETPDYVGMGPEFVRAGEELGYHHCDLNAPFTEGFDIIKYPTKYGIRQAPYQAFLQPIRRSRKKNLVIRKFAHVNRILFKDGNVAYGVEYDRQGATLQAFADKEVIVTAGTVNTAKLLMLSGIGPRRHLQDIGIPVLQDLPVGLNLQDHIAAYVGPFFIDKPRAVVLERDLTPLAFVQWFTGGRGILSSTGAHATGAISSSLAKARGEGNWPDIQFFLFGFSVFKSFGAVFAHGFGLTLDEQKKYYEHAVGKESFLVAVSGARPFSRGFIKLGGRSPYDAPIIDPRYFSDPGNQDLYSMVEGVKILMLLNENTTALGQELGSRFTTEKLPGCEHLPFRTDEYWECYVRRYTVTLHHPVGTASLGQVVDSKLRVFGVQNLRVLDCSVEPVLVVTNTQASTLMIAEKGSHMILEHWKEEEEKAKLRQSQYGPPKSTYGVPEQKSPVYSSYGVPEPRTPEFKYGVPEQKSPVVSYGAPEIKYGVPEQKSPVVSYGVPELRTPETKYGAPEIKYGAPEQQSPKISYSIAVVNSPEIKYGAPEPKTPETKYGTPETKYGIPEQQSPKISYSVTVDKSPETKYGAPEQKPPAANYGTPDKNPTIDYGPPLQSLNYFSGNSVKYSAPTVTDIKYGAPSPPPAPEPNVGFVPPASDPIPNSEYKAPNSIAGGPEPNILFEPPASAPIPTGQYSKSNTASVVSSSPLQIKIPIQSQQKSQAKLVSSERPEEPAVVQLPPKDLITASGPWYQLQKRSGPSLTAAAKNKRGSEESDKGQGETSNTRKTSLKNLLSSLNPKHFIDPEDDSYLI